MQVRLDVMPIQAEIQVPRTVLSKGAASQVAYRPRTVADLCAVVGDTEALPTSAHVTFTLNKGRLSAVGVEVAL